MGKTFYFDHYDWSDDYQTLTCHYQLDGRGFVETVHFPFETKETLDDIALEAAGFGYFMMAGISYYKAALPPQIDINPRYALHPGQAHFFQSVYEQGLGELMYQNDITPFPIVFPSHSATKPNPGETTLNESVIVPLGGGKDSLTSVQLLQDAGVVFQTWTVGDYPGLIPSLQTMHGANWRQQHLTIKRQIDPHLIELNQQGAINGHVPISALWAFLSVITALLTGQKYVAFSNEASANEPTLVVDGKSINHQYSKTLEFETVFRDYVQAFVHPDLEYFSLLRPYSELQIAEIFAAKAWPRFKDQFSSCNRNFTQAAQGQLHWCGDCPKCAFVFLILSPFVPPSELLNVFGRNYFSDPKWNDTWLELLGQTKHKPFECIGTIEEVKKAFQLAAAYYPEAEAYRQYYEDLDSNYNYQHLHTNYIPKALSSKLS